MILSCISVCKVFPSRQLALGVQGAWPLVFTVHTTLNNKQRAAEYTTYLLIYNDVIGEWWAKFHYATLCHNHNLVTHYFWYYFCLWEEMTPWCEQKEDWCPRESTIFSLTSQPHSSTVQCRRKVWGLRTTFYETLWNAIIGWDTCKAPYVAHQ